MLLHRTEQLTVPEKPPFAMLSTCSPWWVWNSRGGKSQCPLSHTSCREPGRPTTPLSWASEAGSLILALADLPASAWPPFVNTEHSVHTKALHWRRNPWGFVLSAGKVTQRARHRPKNSQHLAAAERNEKRAWRMGTPRVPCSDSGHRPLSTFATGGPKHTTTASSRQDSSIALATVYISVVLVNRNKFFVFN